MATAAARGATWGPPVPIHIAGLGDSDALFRGLMRRTRKLRQERWQQIPGSRRALGRAL